MSNHIKIFDTTLRDGQQCPGAGMSFEDNIRYAKLAVKVGIDVVEAGFPAASDSDFTMVQTIVNECAGPSSNTIFAALCQLREAQIYRTLEALQPALPFKQARLHTYLPVDPQLMTASLGSYADDKQRIINDVYTLCKIGSDAGFEVEFSPEGYSRMGDNFDFVTDVITAVIEAGGHVINCPDTIGSACRLQGEDYFVTKMAKHRDLMAAQFPGREITWSMHCHNDFGLALDNSMAGVFAGVATQIEGCINGIGERSGNVSLEQCIMYIKHFGHYFDSEAPLYTQIKTEHLQEISDFVATYMLPRQPHWPITGENAARHTSGGHTNAILNNPLAYQPFDPAEVGNKISLIFGPLSGGNHAKTVIEDAGYVCLDNEKATIAQYIKNCHAERRKGITDKELIATYKAYRQVIKVDNIAYAKSGDTGQITLSGEFFQTSGDTVIEFESSHSALAAMADKISQHYVVSVDDYFSRNIGDGVTSRCEASIAIKTTRGNRFTETISDSDIEKAAILALIAAVNTAHLEENFKEPLHGQ